LNFCAGSGAKSLGNSRVWGPQHPHLNHGVSGYLRIGPIFRGCRCSRSRGVRPGCGARCSRLGSGGRGGRRTPGSEGCEGRGRVLGPRRRASLCVCPAFGALPPFVEAEIDEVMGGRRAGCGCAHDSSSLIYQSRSARWTAPSMAASRALALLKGDAAATSRSVIIRGQSRHCQVP
jgi:hypothetical protein